MNKEITVIDAPCGYGKSSYAIQMINNDIYQDNRYIFVTPFLDEVERVKNDVTNRKFNSPENIKGETKTQDLLNLLLAGEDIVTTHALFQNINDEIVNAIIDNNYILILDEVTKVVEKISLAKGDIKILQESGAIDIDVNNNIVWNPSFTEELSISEFKKIRNSALYGRLMSYPDKNGNINAIIWTFPVRIFTAFKKTYILTYMFNGQFQKYYFDLFNIKFIYKSVKYDDKENKYYLVDYADRKLLDKAKIKSLINLYYTPESTAEGKPNDSTRKLSYNFCTKDSKQSRAMLKILGKNAFNVFHNIFKVTKDDVIWTMYNPAVKSKRFNIRSYKGYVNTDSEINLKDENVKNCFLSHNARATNNYRTKSTVGYLIERNMDRTYIHFFEAHNIDLNEDIWRLSEMIQFVWRSAIRDYKPVNLYIPSKRMRDLFNRWLNSEEFEVIVEKDMTNKAS